VNERSAITVKPMTYEIGPSREQLGNFPQAFTHLALIDSAITLDAQLNAG
jgi:GH15 family glucan-1,4-alpha-glucosidase